MWTSGAVGAEQSDRAAGSEQVRLSRMVLDPRTSNPASSIVGVIVFVFVLVVKTHRHQLRERE